MKLKFREMYGLLILCVLVYPAQDWSDYPLKNGRPTSKGIDRYVDDNAEKLVLELQMFLGDSLYNTNIYTEDLSQFHDWNQLELGSYYPNEIFINNEGNFIAYELAALPPRARDTIINCNQFVKAAVFHELMHHYIYQLSIEMLRRDQISVDRAYQSFFRIYSNRDDPGPRFIEEGICEYTTQKLDEIISHLRPRTPKKPEDLNRVEKEYEIFYRYSAYVLGKFLDRNGLKKGIKILLHNPPPTVEEILEPELFFARLQGID